MMRASVLLALAACGGALPIPEVAVAVRLEAPTGPVALGQPFALAVVRQHRSDLLPQPWTAEMLAPLWVRRTGGGERRVGDMVEHIDRFEAFAFATGEVVVPPIAFAATPRGGGSPQVATSPPLRLMVRSVLPAGDPGQPELAGELLDLPGAPFWRGGLLLLGGCLLAGAVWFWQGHRAVQPAAARLPRQSPQQLALQRLVQLRAQTGGSEAAVIAFYVEASLLLRQYIEQRFSVPALEMTSEELLQAAASSAGQLQQHCELLRLLLSQCDLVKFARVLPGPQQRTHALDEAQRFVQASGEAAAG